MELSLLIVLILVINNLQLDLTVEQAEDEMTLEGLQNQEMRNVLSTRSSMKIQYSFCVRIFDPSTLYLYVEHAYNYFQMK